MKPACIGIFASPEKKEAVQAMDEMQRIAAGKGITCIPIQQTEYTNAELEKIALLVAVGGDGTILRAASLAVTLNIPLLGVNLGRVGFLSEIEMHEFSWALDRLQANEYEIEERMMLCCHVNDRQTFYCLNDVLLYKRFFSSVAYIQMQVNGLEAGKVFCDGLIVSTPTGSTGYSISAGGPIIAPGLDVAIITPICPHSLHARPIVAPASAKLAFHMHSDGCLSVDGKAVMTLTQNDTIVVEKAKIYTKFVRFTGSNLFELIKEKLT